MHSHAPTCYIPYQSPSAQEVMGARWKVMGPHVLPYHPTASHNAPSSSRVCRSHGPWADMGWHGRCMVRYGRPRACMGPHGSSDGNSSFSECVCGVDGDGCRWRPCSTNSDAAALETWYAFLRPVQPPMFQCQLPSKPTDAAVCKMYNQSCLHFETIPKSSAVFHLLSAPAGTIPCCDPLHTTLRLGCASMHVDTYGSSQWAARLKVAGIV